MEEHNKAKGKDLKLPNPKPVGGHRRIRSTMNLDSISAALTGSKDKKQG